MKLEMEPLSPDHGRPVIDIFNHYIEHTFAAFLESPVPYAFFNVLLKTAEGYPSAAVKTETGEVIGFGFLRPHSPIPTMAGTAEISYFLHPDHCGRGVGGILLNHLLDSAVLKGIHTVLAAFLRSTSRASGFTAAMVRRVRLFSRGDSGKKDDS
jgi:phosphinothricin acetyltransferase